MFNRKEIKNTDKYYWTNHVKDKMLFYGFSESLVKRILRFPKRTEDGIAPNTLAVMKPAGSKKNPYELWVMYQIVKNKKILKNLDEDILNKLSSQEMLSIKKTNPQVVIISAWRYPGTTKPREEVPIPEDIRKMFGI